VSSATSGEPDVDAAEGSLVAAVFGGSRAFRKHERFTGSGVAGQQSSVMEQLTDPAEAARGLLQELGRHSTMTRRVHLVDNVLLLAQCVCVYGSNEGNLHLNHPSWLCR
jgi:hypothetical protein